jgi:hypothetical protein
LSEVSTYAWLGMYYFNVKDFIFLFWVVFTELLAEFLHAFAIPFTYFKILLNFYRSTSHLTNRNDMAKLFEIVYTSLFQQTQKNMQMKENIKSKYCKVAESQFFFTFFNLKDSL